jgi:protein-tyrosine phosphatase/Leucine-rich repeat (LRR) protein
MNSTSEGSWSSELNRILSTHQSIDNIKLHNVEFEPCSHNEQLIIHHSSEIRECHFSNNANHLRDTAQFIQFVMQLTDQLDPNHLKVLRVMNNKLHTHVLPCSRTFSKLKLLHLRMNSIQSLPEDFWITIPNIQQVDLSYNSISNLPPINDGYDLSKLRILNLSYNKLSKLSNKFCNKLFPYLIENNNECSELRELNLSYNNLKSLPNVLLKQEFRNKSLQQQSRQCNLQRLDLSMNRIEQMLPMKLLENMGQLGVSTIDLRFNLLDTDQVPINKIPYQIKHMLVGLEDTLPVEILPGIYVGGKLAAKNYPLLKHKGIEYILNVAHKESDSHFPDIFKQVVVLSALDSDDQDMSQYFDMAHDMINKALQESSGILVHCIAGQSRSVCLVLSYLMKYHNMSFNDAMDYVKTRRHTAQPNMSFQIQLMEYEAQLTQDNK